MLSIQQLAVRRGEFVILLLCLGLYGCGGNSGDLDKTISEIEKPFQNRYDLYLPPN
jgi:hypothetical protein